MIRCWMCEQETRLEETDYGDHNCPFCGCMLSIYNPAEFQPYELNGSEGENMKPPKRENKDFEKVLVGEMLPGVIENVLYDQEHKFKGFQGKEDTVQPAVRFKFKLDGYEFAHYSRWYKFSYGEKANLYKIFLSKLVENAQPDMDFDLDLLKGLKVKTLWNENGDFQNLESIFPAQGKVKASDPLPLTDEPEETHEES